jgi:hypothetical protein
LSSLNRRLRHPFSNHIPDGTTEVAIAVEVLNRMLVLGRPDSVRIA